ncbi:MAG: DUF4397 domain-containing protein [Pseudomonadota bacterium]
MRLFTSFMVAAAALLLAGCDRDNEGNGGPVGTVPANSPVVGFVHAVADAPSVNLRADGGTILAGPFKTSSFGVVSPGDYSIDAVVSVPGMDDPVEVVAPTPVSVSNGDVVTVVAIGTAAAVTPIVIQEERPNVALTSTRVRIIHGSPAAPTVDVYVEAPGTDIATASPAATLAFGDQTMPLTIPSGEYQVTITVAGNPAAVAYDSGTIDFFGGDDVVVVAVNNTVPGAAAVSLVMAGENRSAIDYLDTNTPASVRVIHASPDAPNVDVLAGDPGAAIITNLAYTEESMTLEVDPGETRIQVTATGTVTPAVIDETLTLAQGFEYTVLATGLAGVADTEDNAIGALVLVDDNRAIATEARVRIIHAAATAGEVDIFVVEPGTDIAAPDMDGEDVAPAFAGVELNDTTGYVSLEPGSYDVIVIAAEDEDSMAADRMPVIGPATITVAAGGVYSAAARDAAGGGAPFGLILFDDF